MKTVLVNEQEILNVLPKAKDPDVRDCLLAMLWEIGTRREDVSIMISRRCVQKKDWLNLFKTYLNSEDSEILTDLVVSEIEDSCNDADDLDLGLSCARNFFRNNCCYEEHEKVDAQLKNLEEALTQRGIHRIPDYSNNDDFFIYHCEEVEDRRPLLNMSLYCRKNQLVVTSSGTEYLSFKWEDVLDIRVQTGGLMIQGKRFQAKFYTLEHLKYTHVKTSMISRSIPVRGISTLYNGCPGLKKIKSELLEFLVLVIRFLNEMGIKLRNPADEQYIFEVELYKEACNLVDDVSTRDLFFHLSELKA
jgi:hypothetical protein